MPITWSVAVPTLVGSLCSAVATSCVLVCYVIYADQQRSFRHVLVLNLALAGTTPHPLIAASTGQTNHHNRIHQLSEQFSIGNLGRRTST